ncbi:MAG TPA: phage tail sheath C-terminal domain-containing protein, partial [Cellvibrionaceae bacterium]|nr:phage tail sheath C-terminal domain-containing protein [Cellvibrionaceae bacterium]
PNLAKAEVINRARAWEEAALIESLAVEDVTVTRNAQDNNRLDILLSPNIINQLRVLASVIAFKL